MRVDSLGGVGDVAVHVGGVVAVDDHERTGFFRHSNNGAVHHLLGLGLELGLGQGLWLELWL